MNRTKCVNKFIRLKAKTLESRGKQMPPLKMYQGEAVIRLNKKKNNNNNKYIGLRAKAKALKQSTSGESELHEQRKVRVPSAKIALLLSKAFQEPSHHI